MGVQTKCLLEVAEVVVEVEVTTEVEVVASEVRGVAVQILDEDVTGNVKRANFLTFHLEISARDANLPKPQVNRNP